MNPLRPTLLLAALCLVPTGPAAARAKDRGADEDRAAKADDKASNLAASLEFFVGLNNSFEVDPDSGNSKVGSYDGDGRVTLGIIPGFDKMLGRNFGIGGEYMFVWGGADAKGAADERTFIMSPHLRFRMSFPVYRDKVTFDGLLGIGPTIWVANDDATSSDPTHATRMGWSLRFAFGGGYRFNETVAAFTSLGYYTTSTYGDESSVNLNTVPLTVGLRSSF